MNLTLIIPVYNVEKYLLECLDSVLAQDYQDMEILLIDDGSSDNSPRICDEYAKKDARVRVIHQANQGIAEVRNVGVREAKGEYIGFVDSDDFVLLGMVSTVMHEIEAIGADMVVFDHYTFYDDAKDELTEHKHVGLEGLSVEALHARLQEGLLMDRYGNFVWNKICHRSLYAGFTIPKIWFEDLYVMAHVAGCARRIAYVPQAFYCYRLHRSSFSRSLKVAKKYGLFMAWHEHERVCNKKNIAPPQCLYCQLRTQQAAISLKVINMATPYLSAEQEAELDVYLQSIDGRLNHALSFKHRLEYFAIRHLPRALVKLFGMLSVLGDKLRR